MIVRVIVCTLCLSSITHAAEPMRHEDFAAMPVQHDGRIKPLHTLAVLSLQRFHGATKIDGMSADAWLAETVFDPATAVDRPLFLVKNAEARAMLQLPDAPDHRYSFSALAEVLPKQRTLIDALQQQPTQSPEQQAVLTLAENVQMFSQLTLSMTPYLPMELPLDAVQRTRVGMPAQDAPFIENHRFLPELQRALKKVIARKGSDVTRYTPSELALALTTQKLALTVESGRGNDLLRIIPPSWNSDAWHSPWGLFFSGQGSPETVAITQYWQQLAVAYRAQDAAAWNATIAELHKKTLEARSARPFALKLEIAYYHYAPLAKAMALYIVGFVLTLLCVSGVPPQSLLPQGGRRLDEGVSTQGTARGNAPSPRIKSGAGSNLSPVGGEGYGGSRSFQLHKTLRVATIGIASLAVVLHLISIVTRVVILERPPVGTLYESLVFVSLIAATFGLYLEARLRNCVGLLVATLSGSLLLFVSHSFAEGDTMQMLMAVLNTNFWLATHVLCITTGYGFGLVAGILAHFYLIARCQGRDADAARPLLRSAYGTALIALLFTALGTILGGIWADQSWGRFWGWDPKENGALMICLWLIWLLHGRISGHMGERGFSAGLSLVNIVIALAWLGVNLLSTGLHSYGFTDKAAWALAAFCGTELSFAAGAYYMLWRREAGSVAPPLGGSQIPLGGFGGGKPPTRRCVGKYPPPTS